MELAARTGAWAKSGGGVPTAKDYVQDGLVAMFDAEWNAGDGLHDPNATSFWDIDKKYELLQNVSFTENSIPISTTINIALPSDVKAVLDSGEYSVEFVAKTDFSKYYGGYEGFTEKPKFSYGHYGSGASERVILLYNGYGIVSWTVKQFNYVDGVIYMPPHYFCMKADKNLNIYACVDGISAGPRTGSSQISDVGNLYISMNSGCYLNAFRVYNRVLTAAETAANYAIDKVRFNLP